MNKSLLGEYGYEYLYLNDVYGYGSIRNCLRDILIL